MNVLSWEDKQKLNRQMNQHVTPENWWLCGGAATRTGHTSHHLEGRENETKNSRLLEIFELLNLALKCQHGSVQGGLEGSVLSYHCSPGQYPDPVSYRLCSADGNWTPMRSTSGRRVTQATCRGEVVAANKHHLPGGFNSTRAFQTFCVRLSSNWTTARFGPGTSGLRLAPHRASPARRGSLCMDQPRGTAPSPGSGQDSPPSVTTTVREDTIRRGNHRPLWTVSLEFAEVDQS